MRMLLSHNRDWRRTPDGQKVYDRRCIHGILSGYFLTRSESGSGNSVRAQVVLLAHNRPHQGGKQNMRTIGSLRV